MTRILVVDDDAGTRDALTLALTSHPTAAEVVTAGTVDAALVAVARADFDAAVVDLSLDRPAESLHDALDARRIPVLVLSGTQPDDLPAHASRHGWSYLAKPVDASALHDAVDRLLDRSPHAADSVSMDTPTPAAQPAAPAPSGVRPRYVVTAAPSVPVVVQVIDKMTAVAAILALTILALEGKFTVEIAAAILAAGAVDSIPRGIASARGKSVEGGSGAAALGIVGLGLLGALSAGSDAPQGQHTAGESRAAAMPGVLAILGLLFVLGAQAVACGPAREAIVDTQSPRVGCTAGAQRCEAAAPEVCSAAGRWWPALPVSPDGSPRRCAGPCEVVDGVARCGMVTP